MTAKRKPATAFVEPISRIGDVLLERIEAMTDRERQALAEKLELEILRPIMPYHRPTTRKDLEDGED